LRLLALAAASALIAATVAQAQPVGGAPSAMTVPSTATSSPSAPPGVPAARKKDPVICKHQEETGSRLGGKSVCMTKSQWDEQRADAQRNMMGAQATPH
jgi:hypothetical protein